MMMRRVVAYIALLLLASELLLVLVSWLLSATMIEGVRSLLSSEGVRWLCGHFVDIVLSPTLSWILLAGMAFGMVVKSDILYALFHRVIYRERFALRVSLAVLAVYVAVVVWMVAVPQALLLSATGALWPSPFSRALVPLLSFGCVLVSACYGSLSRSLASLPSFTDALAWGVARTAPFLVLYVLAVQLYESIHFVFM